MKNPTFVENEIYHIYNRGVEKRNIFTDQKDYLRFIHDLFEFNDKDAVVNNSYYFNPKTKKVEARNLKGIKATKKTRKLLVEILIFTLMPNHFHLLLKQKEEGGISKFMQKLGIGYTNYFNQKHERSGVLFQGKFKAVLIKEHSHFLHLPFYIHSNPLSLNYGNRISIDFLENYKWSSFLDYIGKKNFPSVTQREFLLNFFGGAEKYKKETAEWLKEKSSNLEKIKEVVLE